METEQRQALKNSNISKIKGSIYLILTAVIWGSGFVAQSLGEDNVSAFTFSAYRTLVGVAALLVLILIKEKIQYRNVTEKPPLFDRKVLKYGAILGVVYFAAQNLQQAAFSYSTAGKIAFITALYMFFVPLIGSVFGKRVSLLTWMCVLAGFVGLYFLTIDPDSALSINRGDALAFGCAIFYAIQILLIEKYASDVDAIKLSFTQFAASGVLTFLAMFIFEKPEIEAVKAAALPILYAGLMSTGVAYTLQMVGQKYVESTVASLLMCMESVFAVLFAALLLHEKMSGREAAGCAIMFAAIIVSQFAGMTKKERG